MPRFTQPLQGEVKIWQWSLALRESEAKSLKKILSKEERRLADKFSTPKLASRYIAGRGGLRQILAGLLAKPAHTLRFAYQAAGKPLLADHPSLHFNLAHSADKALLAVATEPVGVDLEQLRDIRNEAGLVRRWFSRDELVRYETLTESARRDFFFQRWTGKEAIIKLLGGSVGEMLREIVPPDERLQAEVTLPSDNPLRAESCWVTRVDLGAEWSAAVATLTRPTVCKPAEQVTVLLSSD